MESHSVKAQDVRDLVARGREKGYDVGLRDISYALLAHLYEDPLLAFRSIFGDVADVPFEDYAASEKAAYVSGEVVARIPAVQDAPAETREEKAAPSEEGMTYDEIKRGLEEDLKALIALRDSVDAEGYPTLEPKEMASVVGQIATIRVRLVEKFGTVNRNDEQRVVVMQKYDHVCPWCGHEVASPPRK